MANVYVDSNAAGAGTGANWANAYTTFVAAFTGSSAGDVFYVAHNHAESQASVMALTSPGTNSSPCQVYCVNSGGSVPPVSADLRTTATITTTGNNGMTFGGYVSYCYGCTFTAASGGNGNVNIAGLSSSTIREGWQFYSCVLELATTGANGNSNFNFNNTGGAESVWLFDNTQLKYGVNHGSPGMRIQSGTGSEIEWRNTSAAFAGSKFPSILFTGLSGSGILYIHGVGFQDLGSGQTIFQSPVGTRSRIEGCRIGSSATWPTSANVRNLTGIVIQCDSGANSYGHALYKYEGTQVVETTIVRSGGASDGTTSISWKITTTANASLTLPYQSLPLTVWNDTTGSSVTATIYGIWGGGAVPNNNDIWIEAEYLGSSSYPLSSFVNSGLADPLATATALSSDSTTWGGSTTAFKMSVTFTPQMKGYVTLRVYAGAASSTFYIDPLIVLS